jgi:hypothetical protein
MIVAVALSLELTGTIGMSSVSLDFLSGHMLKLAHQLQLPGSGIMADVSLVAVQLRLAQTVGTIVGLIPQQLRHRCAGITEKLTIAVLSAARREV